MSEKCPDCQGRNPSCAFPHPGHYRDGACGGTYTHVPVVSEYRDEVDEAIQLLAEVIPCAEREMRSLIELGVRLGLEAAAKVSDERDEYVTGERIRALDSAAVLRKES